MIDSSTKPNRKEAERGLLRTVQAAATLARRLAGGVAVLAVLSAAAAGVLWGVLWWPPALRPFSIMSAALTLALLLGPAVVLGLFWIGLHDLLALPDRVAERTRRTVEQSAAAAQSVTVDDASGVIGRTWHVLKQIWALRSVLLENRMLLVRYGTLLRFLHPAFLLLVVAAVVASLILIPIAGSALLLAWVLG